MFTCLRDACGTYDRALSLRQMIFLKSSLLRLSWRFVATGEATALKSVIARCALSALLSSSSKVSIGELEVWLHPGSSPASFFPTRGSRQVRAWNGEESSHAQSQQATAAAAAAVGGGGGGGEVGRRTIFLSFLPGTGTRYLPPIVPHMGGRRTRARAFVIHIISLAECSLWGSMPKER